MLLRNRCHSECGRVANSFNIELAISDWLHLISRLRDHASFQTVFKMSAGFGVHFGSTNACLAVCKVRVLSQTCSFLIRKTSSLSCTITHRVNTVFVYSDNLCDRIKMLKMYRHADKFHKPETDSHAADDRLADKARPSKRARNSKGRARINTTRGTHIPAYYIYYVWSYLVLDL